MKSNFEIYLLQYQGASLKLQKDGCLNFKFVVAGISDQLNTSCTKNNRVDEATLNKMQVYF